MHWTEGRALATLYKTGVFHSSFNSNTRFQHMEWTVQLLYFRNSNSAC